MRYLSIFFIAMFLGLLPPIKISQAASNYYICMLPSGTARLIWNGAPKLSWETCDRRIKIIREGFTTTELTFGYAASYDRKIKRFSNRIAGGTTQFIKPGEKLLVLDARLNGLHLVYSQASKLFRFVNLDDLESKLIDPLEISLLKSINKADQIFISIEAPTDFFHDKSLTIEGKMGHGRLFAWRSNQFDKFGKEYVKVVCMRPVECVGKVGWVPRTSLAEVEQYELPKIPFPVIHEFPTRLTVKRCYAQTKTTSSAEIKASILAKAPIARFLGAELEASIEATLNRTKEEIYGKLVRIERTIFTIIKFRKRRFWEPLSWRPLKAQVLVVDRFTQNCGKTNELVHFEITTSDGQFQIIDPVANAEIVNSAAYAKFVTQAKASLKGKVDGWALNHVASALSAQRR